MRSRHNRVCSQDRAHSEKSRRFYLAKDEVIRDVSGEISRDLP